MREYRFLRPEGAHRIRLGRIRQLEEEHYHALLLAEEDPEDGTAVRAALELERRINHHIRTLAAETTDQDDDLPTTADDVMPAEPAGTPH